MGREHKYFLLNEEQFYYRYRGKVLIVYSKDRERNFTIGNVPRGEVEDIMKNIEPQIKKYFEENK